MNGYHPAVTSGFIPLAVAFVLTGLVVLLGRGRAQVLAATSTGMALLVSALLVLGAPPWPPLAATQKLIYLLAGGIVLGVVLGGGGSRRAALWVAALWLLAAGLWLAWPQVERGELTRLAPLALWFPVTWMLLWRVDQAGAGDLRGVVMLLALALGLAGVAFVGGSLVLAQLAGASAAALGGFALWNWPRPRLHFGATGILAMGTALAAIAALLLLLTAVSPWALLVLVPIFFLDTPSGGLPGSRGPWAAALTPVWLALLAAVPIIAAVLLTQYLAPAQSLYYR